MPGVTAADPYIHQYANLKRPDGGTEMVLVVGFDRTSGRGGPPSVVEGDIADFAVPDSVVVRVGSRMGRKTLRTDEPTERFDTKILETLIELDPGAPLPVGFRVDPFILPDQQPRGCPRHW